MVNVLLRGEEGRLLEVGRVVVKVQGGGQGAKAGLLFVFNTEDPSAKDLLEPFSKFDSWTIEDYHKLQEERCVSNLVIRLALCNRIMFPLQAGGGRSSR